MIVNSVVNSQDLNSTSVILGIFFILRGCVFISKFAFFNVGHLVVLFIFEVYDDTLNLVCLRWLIKWMRNCSSNIAYVLWLDNHSGNTVFHCLYNRNSHIDIQLTHWLYTCNIGYIGAFRAYGSCKSETKKNPAGLRNMDEKGLCGY